MSYRCDLCRAKAPPRQARLVHRTFRDDGSIKTESSVCVECDKALKQNVPASALMVQNQSAPLLPQSSPVGVEVGQPVELS